MSVRSSVDPEGRAVHGIVAFDKAVSNVALFADDEDVNDGMAMKAIRRDNRARGGGGGPMGSGTGVTGAPRGGGV